MRAKTVLWDFFRSSIEAMYQDNMSPSSIVKTIKQKTGFDLP